MRRLLPLFCGVCLVAPVHADELLDAMLLFGKGDQRGGLAALRQLGDKGNVQAQIFLGGMYEHPNPSTKDVIPVPDYAEAMKWFMRASLQGSGQASAAVGEMYQAGNGVAKSAEKATEWFDLAARQGWDQQELELQCLNWIPGGQNLACEAPSPEIGCPTNTEMEELRAAGLTGTLRPNGGGTRQRAGPKARALVIMDHPVGGEVTLKQPRRTSVIYVQRSAGWQMIPPNAPLLDRVISLQPQSDAPQYTMAFVQDVDGLRTGQSCAAWPKQ